MSRKVQVWRVDHPRRGTYFVLEVTWDDGERDRTEAVGELQATRALHHLLQQRPDV